METQSIVVDTQRVAKAAANRRRIANDRDRRVMFLLGGLLSYLAGMGTISLVIGLMDGDIGGFDAVYCGVMTGLFALACWRHWRHDETRLWVIGLPSILNLTFDLIAIPMGYGFNFIGIAINGAIVVLILRRRRTLAALRAAERPAESVAA